MLAEHDYRIDSSIFPISGHDVYGVADANKEIHDIETNFGIIREFPPSAWSHGRVHVPIGGGYFRLFPTKLTFKAIDAVHAAGRPVMFYTHPWEFDPGQPKVRGVRWKSRSRHYVGLRRTESRLVAMLKKYRFDTMSAVMAEQREAPNGEKRDTRSETTAAKL